MTETCNVCGGIYMYEIGGYDGMLGNWNGGVCNTCKERLEREEREASCCDAIAARLGDRASGYRCSKCDPDHDDGYYTPERPRDDGYYPGIEDEW